MLLFLVGLLAILCQVVLLRELNVLFYGVELVYALALASWMAGSAAGAAGLRQFAAARSRLLWLLGASAVALPVEVAAVRACRILAGATPGAYLPFGEQMAVLALAILPPAALLGLAFRWAAGLAAAEGTPLARSYAIESAGAVAGSAAATLAFTLGIQTFALALAVAGAVPAALLCLGGPRARRLGVVPLAVAAAALPLARPLELRMTAWSHPTVADSRDTPYARITVTTGGSQTALFADDVLVYESETARHEELAHIAALQHRSPGSILLLGGAIEGIDRELARHGPGRLDVVELDRAAFEVAARQLKIRSTPTFDDPRDFLRRATWRYDLIVDAMPEPTSGQANRFFTSEFFEECRRGLAPGGVLGFRLASPENVFTPVVAARTASILAAVRGAFPFVEALQGSSVVVLASSAPLPASAEVPGERLASRGIGARLVTPAYLRYLYENDRRDALARLGSVAADPNTDARPVCYQFAAVSWLSKFFPEVLRFDPAAPSWTGSGGTRRAWSAPLYLTAAGITVAFVLARRSPSARTVLLAGAAGFAGMLIETVLLLAYQARSGALYERLGLLLTAFMAGLAAGAWVAGAWLRRASGERAQRFVAAALLASLAGVGALTAVVVNARIRTGIGITGALLFVEGATVAAVFAWAAEASSVEGGRAAGRLYGADLAGGALGSILAGLLLVPMGGLAPTAWTAAGLGLIALLLL